MPLLLGRRAEKDGQPIPAGQRSPNSFFRHWDGLLMGGGAMSGVLQPLAKKPHLRVFETLGQPGAAQNGPFHGGVGRPHRQNGVVEPPPAESEDDVNVVVVRAVQSVDEAGEAIPTV